MAKHHIAGVAIFVLIAGVVLFVLRGRWLPQVSDWWSRRSVRLSGYSTLNSFRRDIEAGLNSEHFNIAHDNANDSRKGLDEEGREAILRIMKAQNISFDEARLQYTKSKFSDNQIGEDGMPLDPKAITFSKLRGETS
ncbi:uncharacterized protein CYBJADRAFT_174167 [Cyberlindnera jadinii NRRL Y-1542]|uniref:Uncharacterized protein n=1 Tax=Cyberlindnera jadinii (strain ATCC 18201 / CBS 1600 / BCRC 20928 / JCM 3617 / NBRC 0987 / NRRL Y-1542) TaxID=983966 RepID=A0A1E4RYI5_CYBJN|nr:hypothetical protein CYBJADRAFT_174167 [Cyberlindnera jadinii NRRL Y-1542]ODV72306.1 hypothetical protein CYBJADRAFT_174167 [Cyberlindnera jadinii NRRL Y-1542]